MTIEFQCNGCQETLRAADDKTGDIVRCPRCKTPVTVPAASAVPDVTEAAQPEHDIERDQKPSHRYDREQPLADKLRCPMCGAPRDDSDTSCVRCGESFTVVHDVRSVSPTSFRGVWKRAYAIHSATLDSNAIAFLVCALVLITICVSTAVAAGLSLTAVEEYGGRGPVTDNVIAALYFIVWVIGSCVVFIAICHFALVTARSCKPSLRDLTLSWRHWASALAGMLCYSLMSISLFAPGLALLLAGRTFAQRGSDGMAALLAFPGLLFSLAAAIVYAICLWPIPYMLVDGNMGIGQSLAAGPRMATQFVGLSFKLMLARFALAVVGLLPVPGCVAVVFTYPLSAILVAVAYENCRLAMQQPSE